MKINKKECRKYAAREFDGNKNNGLLRAKQVSYVVQTVIKNIAGQRLLCLYVYDREQIASGNKSPWLVMFQNSSEFVSLQFKDDSTVWRTASFENLKDDYWCFSKQCAFYSKKDEERVTRFCRQPNTTGFQSLKDLQQIFLDDKALKRRRAQEYAKIKRMKDIRALPRDLKKWAAQEILPHYIFYDNKRKKGKGYCTACGRDVEISHAKHNMESKCPRCHKKTTYKSHGRRRYISDRSTGQIIQKSGNDLVIRVVKFECSYPENYIPQVRHYECARIFVQWDVRNNVKFDPYYYSFINDGTIPSEWRAGIRSCYKQYNYIFGADIRGYLYCRNLDKVLDGTPWQYSQLKEFYESDKIEFAAQCYFENYIKHPFIEYFIKLKLYHLASYVVFGDIDCSFRKPAINLKGKNFEEILGLSKEYLPLLQSVNPKEQQLKLLKALLKEQIRPDTKLIRWCVQNDITNSENIVVPLKYMSPHKLMRYIEEQYDTYATQKHFQTSIKNELSDYKDYICMCEVLEYDLTDDFILFPRNLVETHDGASELIDEDSAKVYNNQIAKLADIAQELYGYKFGDFMIVVPRSADEIVEEGQKLHHCVWQYVRKVAFHESVILFLRRISEPNKPLCTIELIDNEIEQSRAYDNENPSPEIAQFIRQWDEKVLKVSAIAGQMAA